MEKMFPPPKECFICYSDGKSQKEKNIEIQMNYKSYPYPIISLAQAYGCKCSTLFAHNRCLIRCKRCSSCSKECRPNLYVKTVWDYRFHYLFQYVKRNIKRYNSVKKDVTLLLCLLCGLWMLCEACSINKQSFVIRLLAVTVSLLHLIVGCIVMMDNYITKYWLYNCQAETYWFEDV